LAKDLCILLISKNKLFVSLHCSFNFISSILTLIFHYFFPSTNFVFLVFIRCWDTSLGDLFQISLIYNVSIYSYKFLLRTTFIVSCKFWNTEFIFLLVSGNYLYFLPLFLWWPTDHSEVYCSLFGFIYFLWFLLVLISSFVFCCCLIVCYTGVWTQGLYLKLLNQSFFVKGFLR
jgi:hypothetical protein